MKKVYNYTTLAIIIITVLIGMLALLHAFVWFGIEVLARLL